jgi:hypothetical protein
VHKLCGKIIYKTHELWYNIYVIENNGGLNMDIVSYMGFSAGQQVRLKPTITTRPSYFNDRGEMDYLFIERPSFKIEYIYQTERGVGNITTFVKMKCVKRSSESWSILPEDIEPSILDNREVFYEKL